MPDEIKPAPQGPAPQAAPPPAPHEIVLNPGARAAATPAAAATPKKADADKPAESKDSMREVVETVVFVVVLVLLLKTFLAEAFVIPTGSMATTLLGYQREVICGEYENGKLIKGCGYTYLVNASKEGDPTEGSGQQSLTGCKCPNCGYIKSLPLWHPQKQGDK